MRNPFKRDPVGAVSTGVNTLVRRFPHGPDLMFWRLHGLQKLELWLQGAGQLRTGDDSDAWAMGWFSHEISTVATSMRVLEPVAMGFQNADCMRSLVLSNVLTYAGERGFKSAVEMWTTYVDVLGKHGLAPHPRSAQPTPTHQSGDGSIAGAGTVPSENSREKRRDLARYLKLRYVHKAASVSSDLKEAEATDATLIALYEQSAGDLGRIAPEQFRLLVYHRYLRCAAIADDRERIKLTHISVHVRQRLTVHERTQLHAEIVDALVSEGLPREELVAPLLMLDPSNDSLVNLMRVGQSGKSTNETPTLDRSMLGEIAGFLRLRYLLRSTDPPPPEFRNAAITCHYLDQSYESSCDSLAKMTTETVWLMLYQSLLYYAFTNDGDQGDRSKIERIYRELVARTPDTERIDLLHAIADALVEPDLRQLNALVPAMALDPSPSVVSTAAMEYATLAPIVDGDPLSGPKALLRLARHSRGRDGVRYAAHLLGLLQLGDWRVLALLDGCWNELDLDGRNVLSRASFNRLYASSVEFWLRWMEAVEEDDFGHPSAGLSGLAVAMPNEKVLDVVRRFPAPSNLPAESYEQDPPIRVVQEWTIAEYARIIEPRLRLLYLRETYDKVIWRVLDAWGLEVGEDSKHDQVRRIVTAASSDIAAMRALGEGVPDDLAIRTADEQARGSIAGLFNDSPSQEALSTLIAVADVFEEKAAEVIEGAIRFKSSEERDRAVAEARFRTDVAQGIRRYLTARLGPEPQTAIPVFDFFHTSWTVMQNERGKHRSHLN